MDSNATFNGTFNGTFDPYQQKVIITLLDHSTVRPTIADLDDFYFYSVHISINYGAQLGASLMLLVVLFLTTKKDKCLSPVFLLNVLSLAINFVRLALMCFYFGGPWSEIYAAFTGDFSAVPASAYNTSYVAIVLSLILLAVIQASLFLQMHVVCFDLRKRYRQALAVMAVVVGMIAIGFHFAFAMQNILSVRDGDSMAPYQRLDSAVNITTTISICWFCAVFVGKLGYSLRQRRKLGLKKFSPMEIIFVGGCQTLLVPAIFSILQYCGSVPAANSNVLTMTVIFLPLSALWAAAAIDGHLRGSQPPRAEEGSGQPFARSPKLVSTAWTGSSSS